MILLEKYARLREKFPETMEVETFYRQQLKFLWIKIKQPILIFDSQARNALGIRNNNGLEDFYVKRRAGFEDNKTAILNACLKLPDMNKYALQQMTKASIREISNQPWFHERVFDTYLWHKGTNA